MRRSFWRWTKFAILIWALLVLFAHPYFAVTQPSGGRVLVAEGWMHREGLRAAMHLFHEGGYMRLYLTGTLRPFAYHLHGGEGFTIHPNTSLQGQARFEITGLPGATWVLLGNGDTLLAGAVTLDMVRHRVTIPETTRELRFMETSGEGPPGVPVVYVGAMEMQGRNMHDMVEDMVLHRAGGRTEPGWPTHAESARAILLEEGVPDSVMRLVPDRATRRRTQASARTFSRLAKVEGVEHFDVATLAVHARRTWIEYTRAFGTRDGVGIIALSDPWCGRWTWWLNYYGWLQVLKEIAALPTSILPDRPDRWGYGYLFGMIDLARPSAHEVPPFYRNYLDLAQGDHLIDALQRAAERTWRTVERIPPGHDDHRYAPDKWSIKELFQHVIDCERIFTYRALRFARNDATELPGFDENTYAAHADTAHRRFHELMREHDQVRAATITLFKSFSTEMMCRSGNANGVDISVHALGWIIAGHATHHMEIIDHRYLGHGST